MDFYWAPIFAFCTLSISVTTSLEETKAEVMDFGESVQQLQWENPTRSTIMQSKINEASLKRGPALTFLDQGPKIIVKPKKPVLVPGNHFGQESSSNDIRSDHFDTVNSFQQDYLEADYIEERQEYKIEEEEDLHHQNERIDLNEVPFYDYLDTDYAEQMPSKPNVVKKSIHHYGGHRRLRYCS